MEEELELSSFTKRHGRQKPKKTETTSEHRAERRLLKMGFVTLGVLCILQVILNISLRLAFHSKEDVDEFPFNTSLLADLCARERSQQNSHQQCSCYNNLLKKLLRKYRALEIARDLLQEKVSLLTEDNFEESGSTEYLPHQ